MRYKLVFVALSGLLVGGCGDYTRTTRQARDDFYAGKFGEAARALEAGAREEGPDQLLFLFDRATALHHAGAYEESIKEFTLAERLAEIKDYTSVSTEAATVVTNDKILPYKGEDFEKILISQYQALNYLMLGQYEDALVECRRVNHKLYRYRPNPMASYLSAAIYESQNEWNDAYVDYQAVRKLEASLGYLGEDLYRLAWKNGIRQDMERWAREYGLSTESRRQIRETASQPEIVVIVENGSAPEKVPDPRWRALPKFVPRPNPVAYAAVAINGVERGRTRILFDVEETAVRDLDEKYAGLFAKRIGGVVAKEVISEQVGKRTDPMIGALLRVGMHALDQADLRSWLTLPKDFQIFRQRVPAGEVYKILIQPRAADGSAFGSAVEKIVRFESQKANQRVFVNVRI